MKRKSSLFILLIIAVLSTLGFSQEPAMAFFEIHGLCVGGQNHGLPCGSAQDCPSRRHSDAVEEVVENGICVGSSLDPGRVIPQNSESNAYATLNELFAASFGAWDWKSEGHYGDKTDYDFVDKSVGTAPITPTPPRLYSLKSATSYTPTGFTWGTENSFSVIGLDKKPQDRGVIQASGSSFPATLNFFAYADNDQMPITRLAVDWGDGSDPYEVRGWFKNRKPWCDTGEKKVCSKDLNRPCITDKDCGSVVNSCQSPVGTDNRLHFGNSFDACTQGYYQFTHLYTCKGVLLECAALAPSYPCWNSTSKSCVFKPKVQVLDNWGWCNASFSGAPENCKDFGGGVKGCWESSACNITKLEPWTPFAGTIEIKP